MNRVKFKEGYWPWVVSAVILAFAWQAPSISQSNSNPSGQGPNGTTASLTAIPAASTLATFTAPAQYITVVNTSSSTTLYVSPVSPATTTSFPILPNSAWSYQGVPLVGLYFIGSAASGNYGLYTH